MADQSGVTTWVAGYAAVVATLALLWNVYVAWRDRADVRVSLRHGAYHVGNRTVHHLLLFEAANRGRRPVTLLTHGFEISNGLKLLVIPSSLWPLPKRLDEGEAYNSAAPLRNLQEALRKQPPGTRLRSVYFNSADGRTFRRRILRWSSWHRVVEGELAPVPENLELLDPEAPLRAMIEKLFP